MEHKVEDVTVASVVILGFGRVGRRVGQILEIREVPYVAVDYDAGLVKQQRDVGRSVFYGDARQLDVLRSLGVGDAKLVMVTVDDFHIAEQVVSLLHRTFPGLDILARGHDLERCRRLRAEGAWLAVSENLEASIALAHAAMAKVRGDNAENAAAVDQFRKAYYADISDAERQKDSE